MIDRALQSSMYPQDAFLVFILILELPKESDSLTSISSNNLRNVKEIDNSKIGKKLKVYLLEEK